MPVIMITTSVATVFEVPEGVDLFQVRRLALSELGDDECATDTVAVQHDNVMSQIYLGAADRKTVSISHSLVDPTE